MKDSEVELMIGKENWPAFREWMAGQTVGLNDDGSTDWYACDVERFAAGLRRGNKNPPIYD